MIFEILGVAVLFFSRVYIKINLVKILLLHTFVIFNGEELYT